MGTLIKPLLVALVTGILGFTVWLQRKDLSAQQQSNALLTQAIQDRNTTIQQLQKTEATHKKQLAQLQAETQRIATTLAERESFIERLQHDNQEVKTWAESPLPDAIVRLRSRSTTTGAGDLYSNLPERDALHPASRESDHER